MKFNRVLFLAATASCLFAITSAKSNPIVADENIRNHRLAENDGPIIVRPIPTSTSSPKNANNAFFSSSTSFPMTAPFKPSPLDDYAAGHEVTSLSGSSSNAAGVQIQPVPAQAQTRPIVTRSLGQTGEKREFDSSVESLETAAQTNYNYNNNGRTLFPGYGLNYGSGGSGNNIPCTSCNTILSSSYGSNACCAHGFSTCCDIRVHKPIQTYQASYYPIITTASPLNHYGIYDPISIFPARGLGKGLFGSTGAIGYGNSYGGHGIPGNHLWKWNQGESGFPGYNQQKPGTCYRPTFGSGIGYNNNYPSPSYGIGFRDNNNAGYSYHRSDYDSSNNIDARRSKRDVYPTQQQSTFGFGSGYGAPNYSSGGSGGYYGGNSGGGHGGIIYPTTGRPSYCRRDYDCPGNQKCCSGYCRTPAFTG